MRLRIYADTSVIGGCFDEEFKNASRLLIEKFKVKRGVGPSGVVDTPEDPCKKAQNSRLKAHFSVRKNEAIQMRFCHGSGASHYLAGQVWHLTHRFINGSFC